MISGRSVTINWVKAPLRQTVGNMIRSVGFWGLSIATAASVNNGAIQVHSRGALSYNLGSVHTAELKIYDSRGRTVKIMQLSGTGNTISTNLNIVPQMLIWRVETQGKVIDQGRISFVVR